MTNITLISVAVLEQCWPPNPAPDAAEVRRRPAIQVTTNWTWYSWAWPHQHGENNHRLNSNSRVTSFTLLQLRNTIYLLYFMHRMQNEEWSWVHRCLLSLMWVPHRAAAGQWGAVRANGEKLLLFVIDGDVLLLSTLYLNTCSLLGSLARAQSVTPGGLQLGAAPLHAARWCGYS